MTDWAPYDAEEFERFRESAVGQRIAEIAREPLPETFEDTIGCDMCGAHIDDPCDCFDPQKERRTR